MNTILLYIQGASIFAAIIIGILLRRKMVKADELADFRVKEVYGINRGQLSKPPTYVFTVNVAVGTTITLSSPQTLHQALEKRGIIMESK